jgi:hypothetical protein
MREESIQADTVNTEATTDAAAKIRIIVMMVTPFLNVYFYNRVTCVVGGEWATFTFTVMPLTTYA